MMNGIRIKLGLVITGRNKDDEQILLINSNNYINCEPYDKIIGLEYFIDAFH